MQPFISVNVIKRLTNLYHLSEEDVLNICSKPPLPSTLRININYISIEDALQSLSTFFKEYDVQKHPLLNDVIIVLPKRFERLPEKCEKEIIVDASCGAAVLRGADIFAPGVLAAHFSLKEGEMVSVYCDVMKKCRKGFGKQFDGEKFFLGNGVSQMSRNDLFASTNKKLRGIAIEMNECKYNLPSFAGLDSHLYFPQNLPSILVGHSLDVGENDVILDMCAAPGGKSSHIARLMNGRGLLISIDKTPNKVERIKSNMKSLNLNNIRCFDFDSTKLVDESKVVTSREELKPPFPVNYFDRILLDPPCSGLGQRPHLRYDHSDNELSSYPILQKKFLKQAVALLRSGGTMVFSTCTVLPEENEAQVAWLLNTFPEMQLVEQFPRIGRIGVEGYGLKIEERKKVQRFDEFFLSNQQNDTIGFFIAKFVKS